ncbi:phage holin family protein [Leptospira wolffii]|uniref:Phage holin family protein n=1 Tax=Leptospira wolffii TaxID=409998 RepID=A0ABV5BMS7_9LEPT|nr:phage holin family protein [Leptospira wolffii]TGL49409.1 hypothetical protein EHQ61_13245 [Leptospira wolffii]
MLRFLISVLLQSLVVIFVFPLIDSDFRVSASLWDAFVIVIFFGILNFILRVFLVVATLGIGYLFYIITLGLAGLVVNAWVLLWIGDIFPGKIYVPGFWPAFWGGAILALANYVSKSDSEEKKNKKV